MAQKQQSSKFSQKQIDSQNNPRSSEKFLILRHVWLKCLLIHASDPHNPHKKNENVNAWQKDGKNCIMEKYNKNNPNVYSGDDKDSKTFLIPLAFTISEGFSCDGYKKLLLFHIKYNVWIKFE